MSSPTRSSAGGLDLGELRITEMDEAGIDMQVISHVEPATQNFEPAEAVRLAISANDLLHQAIRAHPGRFAGFAALPTPDPAAAVRELERAVTGLGFKGAMVHGLTRGAFLDEKPFWPILEAAQRLDVPIYLHPATPHPDVIDAYYAGFPSMVRVGHGFTSEMSAAAIRLVLSEVFDTFPRLQIILGHLGEALPFLMPRVDRYVSRQMKGRTFRETIRRIFPFHHRRQVHPHGAAMHHRGDRDRAADVRGRLAVPHQPGRRRLHRDRTHRRRRQGHDLRRQRAGAAASSLPLKGPLQGK